MDRRTFLKAVFASAVAPASVVRALYKPNLGFSRDRYRQIAKSLTFSYAAKPGIDDHFLEVFRAAKNAHKFQPPKRNS